MYEQADSQYWKAMTEASDILDAAESAHYRARERLVNEIAERVEQKLATKFVRWIGVNILVMVTMIVTVVGSFYNLDKQIDGNKRANDLQDRIIDQIIQRDIEYRREVLQELHNIRESQSLLHNGQQSKR